LYQYVLTLLLQRVTKSAISLRAETARDRKPVASRLAGPRFDDPIRAQSAIDRVISNACDLIIEGESYRPRLKPRVAPERTERARWPVDSVPPIAVIEGISPLSSGRGVRSSSPTPTRGRVEDGCGNDASMEITERFPQPLGNLIRNAGFPHSHSRLSYFDQEEQRQKTQTPM
jgi:hypothetical protein